MLPSRQTKLIFVCCCVTVCTDVLWPTYHRICCSHSSLHAHHCLDWCTRVLWGHVWWMGSRVYCHCHWAEPRHNWTIVIFWYQDWAVLPAWPLIASSAQLSGDHGGTVTRDADTRPVVARTAVSGVREKQARSSRLPAASTLSLAEHPC